MKIPGLNRVKQLRWRVYHKFNPGPVISLYHRITELAADPWAMVVTPNHFAEHLEVLQRHYQIISLAQLVKELQAGYLARRKVVITFDPENQ